MVDIISVSVFGSRPGALDNWAIGIQDPLSQAVYDFPTRGIVVCVIVSTLIHLYAHIAPIAAECYSHLGMERCLPHSQ